MSSDNEKPKKISIDQIEVIDAQGQVIQESKDHESVHARNNPFGANVKVFKGGPAMLLLLPIMIPLVFVGFFLILIFAIFFGRRAFKVIKFK